MKTKLFFALIFIALVNLNSCNWNDLETAPTSTQEKCCGDDLDPIDD